MWSSSSVLTAFMTFWRTLPIAISSRLNRLFPAASLAFRINWIILLADEVTSNCDVACKKEIQDILENSKFNIIFLITHDRHIFSDFQKIIVIENGRIIAIGTYEEVNKFLN